MSQTRIANDNVKRKNIGSNLKLTTSTITTNVVKFLIYTTFFRISYAKFINPNELINQEH